MRTFQLRASEKVAHAYVDLVRTPAGDGYGAGVTIYDRAMRRTGA